MKYMLWISALLLVFSVPACKTDEREKELRQKAADLDRQQEELALKEQSLALKEHNLLERERLLDSNSTKIPADTVAALHPGLPGMYNVTMRCTETTCAGSAVGDIKTEQWQFVIEKNQVIIKAMSDKILIRVYKGAYNGNLMELVAQADTSGTLQAGNMIVRLQESKENQLRGSREIRRQDNCRIVYDLELQKQ